MSDTSNIVIRRARAIASFGEHSFHDSWERAGSPAVVSFDVQRMEISMRSNFSIAALVAASLLGSTVIAAAAGPGTAATPGANPSGSTISPGSAGIQSSPGGSSTSATGIGAGTTTGSGTGMSSSSTVNQPGTPNTSTPGSIGTGASPSGLPGDDPAHPGFPGKVGR